MPPLAWAAPMKAASIVSRAFAAMLDQDSQLSVQIYKRRLYEAVEIASNGLKRSHC